MKRRPAFVQSLCVLSLVLTSAGCERARRSGPAGGEASEQASFAVTLVGEYRGEGFKIDWDGYDEDQVCIGSTCVSGGGATSTFNLGMGEHLIHSHGSAPLNQDSGTVVGTITVDGSGAAIVDSDHFEPAGANTIKPKTVPFVVDAGGYQGALTFTFHKMHTSSFTTRLLVNRRYGLHDVGSLHMTLPPPWETMAGSYAFQTTPSITVRPAGQPSDVTDPNVLGSFY